MKQIFRKNIQISELTMKMNKNLFIRLSRKKKKTNIKNSDFPFELKKYSFIQGSKVKYIFLSYNNEGLMRPEEIEKVMRARGEYGFFTREYGRFRADKAEKRNHTANSVVEYLHSVKCQ